MTREQHEEDIGPLQFIPESMYHLVGLDELVLIL